MVEKVSNYAATLASRLPEDSSEINDLAARLEKLEIPEGLLLDRYLAVSGAGKLVCYPDSKGIHTEGQAYESWILSDIMKSSPKSQEYFDALALGAEKHFPKVTGCQYAWQKGDDDSATDAEILRCANLIRADQNVKASVWKKSSLEYLKLAGQLEQDLRETAIYCFADQTGKAWNLQLEGINANRSQRSWFLAEKTDSVKILYNPSYSMSDSYEKLAQLNNKWTEVESDRNFINNMIIKKYGFFPDWGIVKIDRKTGGIQLFDNIPADPDFGASGKTSSPNIEFVRAIIQYAADYLHNGDKQALAVLKEMARMPAFSPANLKYAGYSNELAVSAAALLAYISGDKQKIQQANSLLKEKVFDSLDAGQKYFGNRYYDSSPHAFNQILTIISLGLLREILQSQGKF